MKLYLVRHGETDANAQNIYQPIDSKLSKRGMEQAVFVANRFESIPVDVIFSSPFERAKQTSETIGKAIGKDVMYTDLLREIKRPSEVIGKEQLDSKAREIFKQIDSRADDPTWHYSDEESFTDLKKRGKEMLSFLEARQEENILCVTHGAFLRMLICLMFQGDMGAESYRRFWKFFRTRNTGITMCTYEDRKWHLLTWNDNAHLG